MRSPATSRDMLGSVPVITNVLPASGPSVPGGEPSSSISRPRSPPLVEVEDVRDVVDQGLVQDPRRRFLAEAVDVHRAFRGEVLHVLPDLARTARAVRADGPDAVLGLDRRRVAGGAANGRLG